MRALCRLLKSGSCCWQGVSVVEISGRMTSVGASVNGRGVYRSAHVRAINGTMYAFHHEVRTDGSGCIEVYRDTDRDPCKVFRGQVREMPGLMSFSKTLGKLLSF